MATSTPPIIKTGTSEADKKGDAKGMEKVVTTISNAIVKTQLALIRFFEGKPLPLGKKHKNPLDSGLVPIVKDLSDIDLCNIFDYAVSKIPKSFDNNKGNKKDGSSNSADGTKKEAKQKTPFQKSLDYIQDIAYKSQKLIDEYYLNFADSQSISAKTALIALCKNLKINIEAFNVSEVSASQDLVNAFPQLQSYNNYINDVVAFLGKVDNATTLDEKTANKIKSYIDITRGVLVAIQSLDPSRITGIILSSLPPKVKEDINKLNKIIPVQRLLPFLKSLQLKCIEVQTAVNLLLTMIRKAQSVISLLLGIVNLFSKVKNFIIGALNAIPSAFATVGSQVVIGESNSKLDTFIKNLIKRLDQVNMILFRTISVIEYVIAQIEQIITYLKIIIANLEACENGDPDIVKDLKKSVESLENTNKALRDFKNNYENKKTSSDSTFGDNKNKYTIKILTEEITDEGILLKRRYGIALNSYGQLVASSTPTFASLDSIIVDEVKLILVSKKLVNPEISSLSPESIGIINEASNYLEDDELGRLGIEDFNTSFSTTGEDVDPPDNENENVGIGLNAFINKLPGGKKLREKVKSRLDQKFSGFNSNLVSTNSAPSSQTGSTQDSAYEKNKKIDDLQQKRAQLVKQRETALKLGPAGLAVVSAKTKQIRDIDKEIDRLKK